MDPKTKVAEFLAAHPVKEIVCASCGITVKVRGVGSEKCASCYRHEQYGTPHPFDPRCRLCQIEKMEAAKNAVSFITARTTRTG